MKNLLMFSDVLTSSCNFKKCLPHDACHLVCRWRLKPPPPFWSSQSVCFMWWRVAVCASALRSRRIWLLLRLWLPAKKSTGASSRDNRYPESLADTSMLTGTHGGTPVAMATHPLWAFFDLCHMNNLSLRGARCTCLFSIMKWPLFCSSAECVLSLLCRGDSPTAVFLNLQPAFRITALLIIHYKLLKRDAGAPQSVIVTWRIILGKPFPTEAHALQAGSAVSSWRKIYLLCKYFICWHD